MLIEAEGVRKSFGSNQALGGVSFAMSPGEVVGLAGVNGAGKSTLLNLVMGFLQADEGRLSVLGVDPLSRRHLAQVGWMPERPVFPSFLTVESALAFQAATLPAWDEDLARDLRQRLRLDERGSVRSLSRGQTARLALVAALASRPDLLVLDDPTLGLDPAARRLLLGELLATAAEAGAGILVSTQLLAEIEPALDRVLVLDHGRLLLDEPVEELKSRWRRIEVPRDAIGLPAELVPTSMNGRTYASAWDEAVWRQFRQAVPNAAAHPVGLEDIFIALTEESHES
ncbi:MAG: ABC transporter ATP-binding protein [Acidobacteriota bacterium]